MSKTLAYILAILMILALLAGWSIAVYQMIIAPVGDLPIWGKVLVAIVLVVLLLAFLYVIFDRLRSRKSENLEGVKW